MAAVAFQMYGKYPIQAVPLTIAFGALSGWAVKKFGPADLQGIGFKYGAGFQTVAAAVAFIGGMALSSSCCLNPEPVRPVICLFSYASSYYILNKKWPMSHKAALVNFAWAGIFTTLTFYLYDKQMQPPPSNGKRVSRGPRR